LSQYTPAIAPAVAAKEDHIANDRGTSFRGSAWLRYSVIIILAAAILTVLAEAILRGSLVEALQFAASRSHPGAATVGVIALALIATDALMRRGLQSILVIGPILLGLAWVGHEKINYLGAPPYPTDLLFARQIAELMPLMVAERPTAAVAICVAMVFSIALVLFLWRWSKRLKPMTWRGRLVRIAVSVPLLAYLGTHMDHASHSPMRNSLKIAPMMWDQKANYAHNGLVLAFAFNVPMANVTAPVGYSRETLAQIPVDETLYTPSKRPDIVMVMSESFWDPTRIPGTSFSIDPIATTRSLQSGHIFSPEFGGMTANVEFEALTGFSNAMLPYGSIPYQQYVRGEMPSLASFLAQEGYRTLAIHPFQGWFWNRSRVYQSFGFHHFLSEENLGPMNKRGQLVSDGALMDRVMAEVDASTDPAFVFTVTLQNHGPYEANRYQDQRLEVETLAGEPSRKAFHTFAEGMMDSDQSLKALIEWAEKRERETIVVFFGDHLPPFGNNWVSSGFMERTVSNRFGEPAALTRERETPLVIWSNRNGRIRDLGTISPQFLPLHTLQAARINHPYYTGFLGQLHERWKVVDRHMLVDNEGTARPGWSHYGVEEPDIRHLRMIQYDIMFGDRYSAPKFFPKRPSSGYWVADQHPAPRLRPIRVSSAL
jgi:phosphoglycerol transferase MdoB-like AlkP superfamily enzyme